MEITIEEMFLLTQASFSQKKKRYCFLKTTRINQKLLKKRATFITFVY